LTRYINVTLQKLTDSSLSWRHRDNTGSDDTSHWQWNAPGVAFMLNTDVALYKDIQVDDDGKSSCGFDTCDASATATAVEAFAASNEVWVRAFAEVYTKMLAHGTTELYDVLDELPVTLDSSTVEEVQSQLRSVVRGSSIATALRLSFHDCVGRCHSTLVL
jgi:hypothetical protein